MSWSNLAQTAPVREVVIDDTDSSLSESPTKIDDSLLINNVYSKYNNQINSKNTKSNENLKQILLTTQSSYQTLFNEYKAGSPEQVKILPKRFSQRLKFSKSSTAEATNFDEVVESTVEDIENNCIDIPTKFAASEPNNQLLPFDKCHVDAKELKEPIADPLQHEQPVLAASFSKSSSCQSEHTPAISLQKVKSPSKHRIKRPKLLKPTPEQVDAIERFVELTYNPKRNSIVGCYKLIQEACPNCDDFINKDENVFICSTESCAQKYHDRCVGKTGVQQPKKWQCADCRLGLPHRCIICRRNDIVEKGPMIICPDVNCRHNYHELCARNHKFGKDVLRGYIHVDSTVSSAKTPMKIDNKNKVKCPSHVCVTCHYERDGRDDAWQGKFIRCTHCVNSYHRDDRCIPAGSTIFTYNHLVCPARHIDFDSMSHEHKQSIKQTSVKGRKMTKKPSKGKCLVTKKVNLNDCEYCGIGGSLLCCESCPASAHANCIYDAYEKENRLAPNDTREQFRIRFEVESEDNACWRCDNCLAGKEVMVDDVLFVKYGNYAWWPAVCIHPMQVPEDIEKLSHDFGDFVIQFLGTHDYAWISKGRCYEYEPGDRNVFKQTKAKVATSLKAKYNYALMEAAVLYSRRQERINAHIDETASKKMHLKPKYTLIQKNKSTPEVKALKQHNRNKEPCECTPEQHCSTEACDWRFTAQECDPKLCSAGAKCSNQRMQRKEYAEVEEFFTNSVRGWGLRAKKRIKEGDFVIEYIGELISPAEMRRRQEAKYKMSNPHFYFMTLDKDRIIDADRYASKARLINHSCEPNCQSRVWQCPTDKRVGLFALRDIEQGEELSFDYKWTKDDFASGGEESMKRCLCGAAKCRSTLLQHKGAAKPKVIPSSKKRKNRSKSSFGRQQNKKNNQADTQIQGSSPMCLDVQSVESPSVKRISCESRNVETNSVSVSGASFSSQKPKEEKVYKRKKGAITHKQLDVERKNSTRRFPLKPKND